MLKIIGIIYGVSVVMAWLVMAYIFLMSLVKYDSYKSETEFIYSSFFDEDNRGSIILSLVLLLIPSLIPIYNTLIVATHLFNLDKWVDKSVNNLIEKNQRVDY